MNDDVSIQAALWTMVIVQTIGSVDLPGRGPRKLPSPRSYVIILVAMGALQLASDAGYSRAAKTMAWLAVGAAVVLGPFGQKLVSFFNTVASAAPPVTTSATGQQSGTYSSLTNSPF